MKLSFVPLEEIRRVRKNISDPFKLCEVLADIVRLNTLYMIMRAGAGHIGSSFSSTDIVTWLWTQVLRNPNEPEKSPSDTYFSSKGHDVPALYSLLIALGKLDFDYIHKLRRLGGLPGHPDVSTPYIAANTGSLGMGISKARGMAKANRLKGQEGKFYVLTGDGELQEGQIWESLQPSVNGKFSEITVIVDHNKFQSDLKVEDTSGLGNLEEKFRAFGWEVARCDGHDFKALKENLDYLRTVKDRPQILIADTIKGQGVSFMERTGEDGFYKFHSGAPSPENYEAALGELVSRLGKNLKKAGLAPLNLETTDLPPRSAPQNPQKLVQAYGDELLKIAREKENLVALDADLVVDTGLAPFKKEFPARYIECGIAEQDMVSMAGGLALRGFLPVAHSLECFLSARPNEHFYTNASEKTKIIYVGSQAGLLPGMPGHSHQSVRGISALGSIPGLTLIEPANERETRLALRWAVEENLESTYIRLVSIPMDLEYELPENYELHPGRGAFLKEGKDAVVVGYGPSLLNQAVKAAKILEEKNISLAVLDLPWLNLFDSAWLFESLKKFPAIFTLDDHYLKLGQGIQLSGELAKISPAHPRIFSFGLEEIPACGWNDEVLKYHGLDAVSLAEKIQKELGC